MIQSRITILSALLFALAAAPTLHAGDAARFAPADAEKFIEIDNLAELLDEWQNDPLAKYLRDNLPLGQSLDDWDQPAAALGMTREEMVRTLFGRSVAVVFANVEDKDPAIIITKVPAADAERAADRLGLKQIGETNGFKRYQSKDNTFVAVGQDWVIVSNADSRDAAGRIIAGDAKTLADDETFKQWTAKLPAERTATMFLRDDDAGDRHVFGLVRDGRDFSLRYVGESPNYRALFAMLRDGRSLEFGPLPASTIAAVTSNLITTEIPNSQQLDRFFTARSFSEVLESIDTPGITFLGEVDGANAGLDIDVKAPVPGIAVRLKDPAVADDVTRALDTGVVLINIASMKWKNAARQLPKANLVSVDHEGVSFRYAGLGELLAAGAGRDELKMINLAYGRVGDYYVICTNDHFFKQCIDADRGATATLIESAPFKAMPLTGHDAPVATLFVRTEIGRAHV